jgi:hypothetical protein
MAGFPDGANYFTPIEDGEMAGPHTLFHNLRKMQTGEIQIKDGCLTAGVSNYGAGPEYKALKDIHCLGEKDIQVWLDFGRHLAQTLTTHPPPPRTTAWCRCGWTITLCTPLILSTARRG